MAKKSASLAVADLIALAAQKTGWSIAKLNRYLGKGENTLHRWKAGKMNNFGLAAIVEMCRLAEVSMDSMFGHEGGGQVPVGSDAPQVDVVALQSRVLEMENTFESIKPLIQVVDGLAALVARQIEPPPLQEIVAMKPAGLNLDPDV